MPDAGEQTLARIVRDVGSSWPSGRPRRRICATSILCSRARSREPLDVVDDALTGACNPALERVLGHRAFMHLNLHLDGVLRGPFNPA